MWPQLTMDIEADVNDTTWSEIWMFTEPLMTLQEQCRGHSYILCLFVYLFYINLLDLAARPSILKCQWCFLESDTSHIPPSHFHFRVNYSFNPGQPRDRAAMKYMF